MSTTETPTVEVGQRWVPKNGAVIWYTVIEVTPDRIRLDGFSKRWVNAERFLKTYRHYGAKR
jgi:hypothetical protein